VFGSVAAEIVAALNATSKLKGKCPEIYKQPFYLVIRVAVALIPAGGLPLVLGADNVQTAFYLGLSAPLFLDRLQKGLDATAHPIGQAPHPTLVSAAKEAEAR
jgi:hypothetical protein